ncbi:MAG: hypothetical protein JWL58_1941 [Streptosporangiaceae bacterium]|jgi:hypothetical protein|nr:hypothetical protein [Streptosporangiaceae bacterium]
MVKENQARWLKSTIPTVLVRNDPPAVARKLGLSPTDERAGGEIIWRS